MEWETLEELQEITNLRVVDPYELYKNLENHIDYDIRYAEDRVDLLTSVWDEELYVDCVSDERFRNQQVKKKSSPSSEDTPMTQHLDKLADYILYSHFDNEEQEKEFDEARRILKETEAIHKKERTEQDEKVITKSKDKLRNKPLMMSRRISDTIKREANESLQQFFENSSSTDIYKSEFPQVTYTKVDKELNQKTRIFNNTKRYWEHYTTQSSKEVPHYLGKTETYADVAYSSLLQMEESIKALEPRIKDLDFFDIMEKERLKKDNIVTHNEIIIKEIKALRRLKRELQADYNISAELLRKPTILKSSFMSIDEVIPNSAWERLSFRLDETYHALIMGYGDLKERYSSKVGTTMWCLIYDFEKMISNVKLSPEEDIVLNRILQDGKTPLKSIQEEIYTELDKEVSIPTVSNMINKNIPKKFREYYDEVLEDWIWIHRRKGTYKTCSKCGEVKLTKYFSADKRNLDGLHSFCKECRAKSN